MIELTPTTIYAISTIDELKDFLGFITVFGIIFALVILLLRGLMSCDEFGDSQVDAFIRWYKSVFPKTVSIVLCAFLLNVFLPNQKTIAAMIVVPAIANNENIQHISKYTLQWAEEYIKDQLQTKKKND